jgi:hypothetical protein
MVDNSTDENTDQAGQASDTSTEETIPGDTPLTIGEGLISTTEFLTTSEGDEDTEESQASAEEGGKTDGEGSEDELSDEEKAAKEEADKLDKTFQDSPRFQQMHKQNKELTRNLTNLEGQVQNLTTQLTAVIGNKQPGNQDDNQGPTFQDISQMTDETIIETLESDPKGFLANFGAQIAHETEQRIMGLLKTQGIKNQQTSQEQAIRDLYAKYETDNPDFVDMWEAGTISEYMDKNPGTSPIAAHKILKARAEAEETKTASEAAITKAREEERKKLASKKQTRVIKGGPSDGSVSSQSAVDAELENTKNSGGLIATLTNRSLRREKAQQ